MIRGLPVNRILNKLKSSLSFNTIGSTVFLLLIFGAVISAVSLINFTNVYKEAYAVSSFHMADTATTLVNGDHIDEYLAGGEVDEYQLSQRRLDLYCEKICVSLLYVIKVDRSDYGSFVSVFNSVNNTVDSTSYTRWELGFERSTTNEEYAQKYEALYNRESQYETIYRKKVSSGVHPHITIMVPVKNSDGDVVAILCMQRPMSEINAARKNYLASIIVFVVLVAVLTSVSSFFYMRSRFLKPIRKVSSEATRFARENTKGKNLGKISRFKELSDLADSIDTMETDMVNYMENLTAVTAEKQRINTELSLANRIQAAMMPHVFPPFPDRAEFEIYASMDPAKEVGGDFYDFFLIDDDHLGMVIADVSGKGVPAALFMMASKIILQSCAMLGGSPAEILTKTNEAICSNNQEEMFVTVWLGILEISTGKLTAANAGHEYPVVRKAGGCFELFKDRHGFVIGGMPGSKYREYEIQMEPGAKLFLYTDGVPEATDADKHLFGTERMIDALNEDPEAEPEQVLRNVRKAVDSFVKDAEQFDDLTMLCLEYKGK